MKKKKICFIIPNHISYNIGGAQYQAECIIQEMIKYKHFEIIYLTRNFNNLRSYQYKILKISDQHWITRHGLCLDYFNLLNRLNCIKPDVIYQRVGNAYTGIGALYSKRNNIKMIWHIASNSDVQRTNNLITNKFKFIDRKFFRYGVNNVDAIIAQTKQQAEDLYNNYGKRVFNIIPNFHPLPNESINKSNTIKIVWIANLKKIKQPNQFIRLARDFQSMGIDAEFIMVGKNFNYGLDRLHSEIDGLKKFKYLGPQPLDKVNKILAESHLFVNTSILEGFPNTFIQAWMREVPVISLHYDPDNILTKYDIGYLAGSYEKMKNMILKLILNPTKIVQMGKKAKIYAYDNHSLKNINKVIQLIECL